MKSPTWSHILILSALLSPGSAWGSNDRPYTLELVGESGRVLPTYQSGGRAFVLGERGQRYSLRIHNRSAERIEVVASVDGRDVLDGRPSEGAKPGYVLGAYGEVVIDGFRLSHEAVAAFRFSDVRDSYASRMGDSRDVGVIGVAVFPERPRDEVPARDGRLENLSAPATASPPSHHAEGLLGNASEDKRRAGLGTEFGEQRSSHVEEVQFERASSVPQVVLTLRYDDRPGLLAMGVNLGPGTKEVGLRQSAEPFRRDPAFSEPPPGWSWR